MISDKQDERRRQIEKAAFELLAEKGYRSTSMLQIAKKASASNQTLYAWYGNKQGLFQSIIEINGRIVKGSLEQSLNSNNDPRSTLNNLGLLLLEFITGEKAQIINRAAISDVADTGLLSAAINKEARGVIYPLICSFMERLGERGYFTLDHGPEDAADSYLGLLLGETQIRESLGTVRPLSKNDIKRRSSRAADLLIRLYQT